MSTPLEILARDEADDLALIGVTFTDAVGFRDRPPARLATGDSRRLSSGSFVYTIGIPPASRW